LTLLSASIRTREIGQLTTTPPKAFSYIVILGQIAVLHHLQLLAYLTPSQWLLAFAGNLQNDPYSMLRVALIPFIFSLSTKPPIPLIDYSIKILELPFKNIYHGTNNLGSGKVGVPNQQFQISARLGNGPRSFFPK